MTAAPCLPGRRPAAALLLALLLTACAAPLPLAAPHDAAPAELHYHARAAGEGDSLIVGHYQDGQWRWVQTTPLGAPLARQIYDGRAWHNDGFLPPNRRARTLFTALMLLHDPAAYPHIRREGDSYYHRNRRWLRVEAAAPGFLLHTAAGDWHIAPLGP